MTSAREHALFKKYPLTGEVSLSTGTSPTPYHIYGGSAIFIGGTADIDGVRTLLSNQQVHPVETKNGRALMGIWVVDGADGSLGAHQELQVSFFISQSPLAPVEPHSFIILSLLLKNPAVKMMAHAIWNDSETVVAYNREHLGLDSALMKGDIQTSDGCKQFTFYDALTDALLLKGEVTVAERPPTNVIAPAIKAFGFMNFLKNLSLPVISADVVNPIRENQQAHLVAPTFTKNDAMLLQFFNPAAEAIKFGEGPYKNLDFQPEFVEHMTGFKFVYLDPKPWK